MADNDFEQVCEAYWNEISGGACWSLHGERVYGSDREFVRRGMAAALREMQAVPISATLEQLKADGFDADKWPAPATVVGAFLYTLLAQAEDREAAQ